MLKSSCLMFATLLSCSVAHAQIFQRELGDFDLKLGTTPSRSMAQGLVKPSTTGSFHGGLDLGHDSGWYVGQWAPSMGVSPGSNLEVDSYLGFKQPFDKTLGYEVGMMHYSYPEVGTLDSQEFFGGLTVLGSRFGAAFSNDPDKQNSTLFADLGGNQPFGIGVSMKYTTHQLNSPVSVDGGSVSTFTDWSLQLSRAFMGIDLDLIYSDSSLSGSNCSAYSGHNSQCDGLVTLKAERAFY
ncbi:MULTISPECIES: TorF family putative porin [unclassified Pseudomonas]|uniref:TorF family putative porin n=1 Tax=unclassified Pseudomonas TaxID=196821 RepID=UPI002AC9D6D6|nr:MULTISPECIES: TorF family putative porin [unclassified Pseudomonas]MEB0048140.1 TorF family putative porin [Pseudomonas sp. Dout3]MEB0099154.1 TorF family putative porin [Pseudomonas sp. DC1.2]WPX57532.1 TorF family putative porin [Pseudomonas sp. DC1.2]